MIFAALGVLTLGGVLAWKGLGLFSALFIAAFLVGAAIGIAEWIGAGPLLVATAATLLLAWRAR